MAERSHKISERGREIKRVSQAARRAGLGHNSGAASEAEGRLHSALVDILASPPADVRSFLAVAGIGGLLERVTPERFWPAFRQHYTTETGEVDEARLAADLSIWPPVASRVAELRAGRG